jgi:photosystem II stability/assembly factor-like uncharacterized protein
MLTKRLLALTLFTALASVMPACVLRAQWQPTNGLYGGEIGSFATDGHTLFLSIATGKQGPIFQSTNGGLSWSENKEGLPPNDFLLYLVGSNGTEVFATDENAFGYYWSNDTAKWVETGYLWEPNSFAHKDTDLFEGLADGEGMRRSTNNGLTWTFVNTGLNLPNQYYDVRALAVIDSFLFAGVDYSGVFRSSDNGDHWIQMDSTDDSLGITCFLVSGENLFAAAGEDVLLSTDYGENWKDASDGLPNSGVNALAEIGSILFACTSGDGIYISSDNGSSWQSANSGLPNEYVNALCVIGDTLFAGTIYGVFISTDTGQTWNDADIGLLPMSASTLLTAGKTLYATADYGGDVLLYRTNDSGTHWRVSKDSISTQPNYSLEGFSSLISQGPNLYACNWGVFLTETAGHSGLRGVMDYPLKASTA